MEEGPDKSGGANCAQIPWSYLQEAIRVFLKCLGLEVSSSQGGGSGVSEPNPQHPPSTTDPDADPPSVSVEDTATTLATRPSQPRPPISSGGGPQTN